MNTYNTSSKLHDPKKYQFLKRAFATKITVISMIKKMPLTFLHVKKPRRRKYEGISPDSYQPIFYFGSIWELYVLDLKEQPCTLSDGQGTHSAKLGAVVWPKIPQMPPIFSAQFVCPSPKVSDFRKKALSGCP